MSGVSHVYGTWLPKNIVECVLKKRLEFIARTVIGALPVIAVVMLLLFLKTGTFCTAIEDTQFTILPAPYYLTI